MTDYAIKKNEQLAYKDIYREILWKQRKMPIS